MGRCSGSDLSTQPPPTTSLGLRAGRASRAPACGYSDSHLCTPPQEHKQAPGPWSPLRPVAQAQLQARPGPPRLPQRAPLFTAKDVTIATTLQFPENFSIIGRFPSSVFAGRKREDKTTPRPVGQAGPAADRYCAGRGRGAQTGGGPGLINTCSGRRSHQLEQ